MAKASGNTRGISSSVDTDYGRAARENRNVSFAKPFPFSEETLNALFRDRLSNDDVDINASFLNSEYNAFYIQFKDRTPDDNEKPVIDLLIENGISIELTPEGVLAYATAFSRDNVPRYTEGKLSNYTYEQKTIDITALNAVRSIKYGIDHAIKKNAQIGVIYDRFGKIKTDEQVYKAIKEYKLPAFGHMPEAIVIISEKGKIKEYYP